MASATSFLQPSAAFSSPPDQCTGRFDVLFCENIGKQRPLWLEGRLTVSSTSAALYGDAVTSANKSSRRFTSGTSRHVCTVRQATRRGAEDKPAALLYLRMAEEGIAEGDEFALSGNVAVQIMSVKALPSHCPLRAGAGPAASQASAPLAEASPPPRKGLRAERSLHSVTALPRPAQLHASAQPSGGQPGGSHGSAHLGHSPAPHTHAAGTLSETQTATAPRPYMSAFMAMRSRLLPSGGAGDVASSGCPKHVHVVSADVPPERPSLQAAPPSVCKPAAPSFQPPPAICDAPTQSYGGPFSGLGSAFGGPVGSCPPYGMAIGAPPTRSLADVLSGLVG